MAQSSQPPPDGVPAWRILVRLFGGIALLALYAFWAAAGSNLGWTKTQVPLPRTDEVTGISYVEYEKRFVPGVDVLALGGLLGAAALGATFLPRRRPAPPSSQP
jgi:hypothetical protein